MSSGVYIVVILNPVQLLWTVITSLTKYKCDTCPYPIVWLGLKILIFVTQNKINHVSKHFTFHITHFLLVDALLFTFISLQIIEFHTLAFYINDSIIAIAPDGLSLQGMKCGILYTITFINCIIIWSFG